LDAPVVFGFYRSECGEDECEVYRFEVHSDGVLTYEGHSAVEVRGRFWARISPEKVSALVALELPPAESEREGHLPIEYALGRACAIDVPTVSLFQRRDGVDRSVCAIGIRMGPKGMAPKHLERSLRVQEVEAEALRILGAEGWVKHKRYGD
jgi:Domain of unknown function (DUF6438)